VAKSAKKSEKEYKAAYDDLVHLHFFCSLFVPLPLFPPSPAIPSFFFTFQSFFFFFSNREPQKKKKFKHNYINRWVCMVAPIQDGRSFGIQMPTQTIGITSTQQLRCGRLLAYVTTATPLLTVSTRNVSRAKLSDQNTTEGVLMI
jgi:hypothetical protein